MRRGLWTAALLALLLTSVVGLQALRERGGGLTAAPGTMLYVQSPAALKRMALSYHSLLADVYWIRAVQHYGDTKLGRAADRSYALLYPLLDLTTSLDPHFAVAYQFGALFLAEAPPGGPGRPDQAITLLEKGIKVEPEAWQLYQAVGFVHYWSRQDYTSAADWFRRASQLPGAPTWMAPLAAVTLAEGGNRQASRALWQEVLKSQSDDWFRAESQRRLRQLDAMDQLDELRRVVTAFEARQGRVPASWAELAQAGYVRGAIVDPAGSPYHLDDGMVSLDPASPLQPLPKESGPRQ